MRATLIAGGPAVRPGMADVPPSGNADVAPIVQRILGIKADIITDGRVLNATLVAGPATQAHPQTVTLEATTKCGDRRRPQYLKMARLGQHSYYDEGNGKLVFER